MNAESQYGRVVFSAWALSRRPRLYTPTGSLTEVVAYLAGMLESLGPSFGDRTTLDVAQRFAEWLTARHGGDDPDALSNAARICSTLSKASSDPIDAMWHEFNVDFGTEGRASGPFAICAPVVFAEPSFTTSGDRAPTLPPYPQRSANL